MNTQKRVFEIIDRMNQHDEINKTDNVAVSFTIVSLKKCRQGGLVTMGVSEKYVMDMMELGMLGRTPKKKMMLLVIESAGYARIENEK